MLISFMSFQVRVKYWWGFNLGEGKHQVCWNMVMAFNFVLDNTRMQGGNENL